MSFQEVCERLEQRIKGNPYRKPVKFDFGDDGIVILSGETAHTEDRDAVCTVHVALPDFVALLDGRLNALVAFGMNKIRVTGDKAHALRLVERLR